MRSSTPRSLFSNGRRWLCLLVVLGAACGGSAGEPAQPVPAEAPTIRRPAARPDPTPISRNPERRKLDPEGHLMESADAVLGYRLPMGIVPYRRSDIGVILRIQTSMERLVQFYSSRGYHVVKGREGYKVLQSKATLAQQEHPERLKGVTAYLQRGPGRVREIRIVAPRTPPAISPEEEQREAETADMPPVKLHAPSSGDPIADRLRAWQRTHPGQQIID